jgi:hypothetical protein
MKTKKYYLILVAVTGILSAPALAQVETTQIYESALIGRANPALVGVEKVYIELRSELRISHVGITTLEDIHKKVQNKLDRAGIKIYPRPFLDANVKPFSVPELRIDIATLKLEDFQQIVFRIQTSLARMVNLPKHRFEIRVDVWSTEPIMQAASVENMPDLVTNVVLEQVEAFICACLAANPPEKQPLEAQTSDAVSQTTQKRQSKPAAKPVTAQYNYLASKNSKVFHRSDCSSAKRIKPENLVIYNSRDEAINAGKRPCKLCKP